MEEFRKGDFIRLKNTEKYHITRVVDVDVNIFEIKMIQDGFVEVRHCENRIPISEIEAISINGKDDRQIYYDPIVMASIVGPDDPVPCHNADLSYYFESFKRSLYGDKNFQELITARRIQHVHEVQHFLIEQFHDDGLKINAH